MSHSGRIGFPSPPGHHRQEQNGMEARGRREGKEREEIIWKENDSEGEKVWLCQHGSLEMGMKRGGPENHRKLSTVEQKLVYKVFFFIPDT